MPDSDTEGEGGGGGGGEADEDEELVENQAEADFKDTANIEEDKEKIEGEDKMEDKVAEKKEKKVVGEANEIEEKVEEEENMDIGADKESDFDIDPQNLKSCHVLVKNCSASHTNEAVDMSVQGSNDVGGEAYEESKVEGTPTENTSEEFLDAKERDCQTSEEPNDLRKPLNPKHTQGLEVLRPSSPQENEEPVEHYNADAEERSSPQYNQQVEDSNVTGNGEHLAGGQDLKSIDQESTGTHSHLGDEKVETGDENPD